MLGVPERQQAFTEQVHQPALPCLPAHCVPLESNPSEIGGGEKELPQGRGTPRMGGSSGWLGLEMMRRRRRLA